jgi:hypothetical protein
VINFLRYSFSDIKRKNLKKTDVLRFYSYLYHKSRKRHFASGLWGRGVSRGPQVGALAKHFLAVQYTKIFRPTIYKQNMIIFVKKLPDREFIFLPLAT